MNMKIHIDPKLMKLAQSVPIAGARAINRGLTSGKADMSREVRSKYTIKGENLNRYLKLIRATSKRLAGKIFGSSSPIPLMKYKAKQNKAGVVGEITKGRPFSVIHGFVATMKSGHRGAYIRTQEGGKMVGRLPLRELMGPAVTELASRKKVLDSSVKKITDMIIKTLLHEVEYEWSKKK